MSELQKLPDLVVLVADESVHMRRIVREILLRSGIKRILEAADGADAIAQYTTLLPDVVILEWDLPILSGEDFIRLARTSPETAKRDTPIVLMLANPQKNVVSLAIKLGIKDICAKPLSPKALCSRVFEAVVRARESQRQRLKAMRSPGGAPQKQIQAPVAAAG
jgi:two-component system, chemotaxis family, chemotaxis protein CheY